MQAAPDICLRDKCGKACAHPVTGAPPDYHFVVTPDYGPDRIEPRWRDPLKRGKDRRAWWYSVPEVAAATGKCGKTVYRWIERGWLKAHRAQSRQWFVKGADLEAFIEGQGQVAP